MIVNSNDFGCHMIGQSHRLQVLFRRQSSIYTTDASNVPLFIHFFCALNWFLELEQLFFVWKNEINTWAIKEHCKLDEKKVWFWMISLLVSVHHNNIRFEDIFTIYSIYYFQNLKKSHRFLLLLMKLNEIEFKNQTANTSHTRCARKQFAIRTKTRLLLLLYLAENGISFGV